MKDSEPVSPGARADPELAKRAAAGDEEALEQLIRDIYPHVRRWALTATGDPSEADEVTQEVLVKVLRGLAGWKGDGQFTTWLYRITANAVMDRRRRRERHLGREVAIVAARSISSPSEDPGTRVDRERAMARLKEAFLGLPRRQREVLDLADFQGFTSPEIAKMLGIASSSVRVTLLKARRALRAQIATTEENVP